MKRRLLTIAAVAPVLAAPVLMTADEPAASAKTVAVAGTAPIRTAAISVTPTPRTTLPADAAELDLPQLDASGSLAGDAEQVDPTVATLREHIALLETARDTLAGIDCYTAELTKQERVDGELKPAETTKLKLRHAPFSVYMKWTVGDRGREVLYIDGENDNEMLVHPGGWKGRFLPTMSIDPAGSLAMSQSRHSVAEAGLRNLVAKHLEHRHKDLTASGVTAATREIDFEGEPSIELSVSYADPAANAVYSRTVLILDAASGLPVASRNYGWTALDLDGDDARLIERYEYRELASDAELCDADFDRTNRRYMLRR